MSEWKSRIVGEDDVDPEELLANPMNWRVHPKHQQKALEDMLNEVGWVQRVIVNQQTGHVVDGHARVTLALRREEPTIPVLYVDLSLEEEKKVLATLDPIGAMAVADESILRQLLDEILLPSDLQGLIEGTAQTGIIGEEGSVSDQDDSNQEPRAITVKIGANEDSIGLIRETLEEWSKWPGIKISGSGWKH